MWSHTMENQKHDTSNFIPFFSPLSAFFSTMKESLYHMLRLRVFYFFSQFLSVNNLDNNIFRKSIENIIKKVFFIIDIFSGFLFLSRFHSVSFILSCMHQKFFISFTEISRYVNFFLAFNFPFTKKSSYELPKKFSLK